MKKLTGLLVLSAALLLALPTPRAGAVAPPAGPFFLCVNTTAKPPLPNARVVTSMTAGLPFEFLVDLNTNPTNNLSVGVVCDSSSVPGLGGFNQQAMCPTGDIVLSGGYSCTDTLTTNGLLPVTVEENTFLFGGAGGVTPIGWQTVGLNNTEDDGNCRVCVTCAPGACKDPSVCAP
jgi:hypothetical protein